VLRKIYRGYLVNEVRRPLCGKNFVAQTEKDLFSFLKDFDICPYLATKSVAHSLFSETLATEPKKLSNNAEFPDITQLYGGIDEGVDFTFSRFLAYLVRMGIYIFSDINNLPVPQKDLIFSNDEKFYLLLERMDISSGFMNLSQKISKNNCSILRLTLDHEELDGIHLESQSFPNFFPADEKKPKKRTGKGDAADGSSYMYIKLKQKAPRDCKRPAVSNLNRPAKPTFPKPKNEPGFVIKNSAEVIKRHQSALRKIFEIYCNLGEPQNYTFLKHIKF
jgi:hypothetical protein